MLAKPIESFQRQVHLDFHTSPFIPDVGSEFNGNAFARTFKDADVNSVTVFAKCHHGMSYYPTKVGTPHPALKGRDLLGEQIEALHREGIRCPIYTTVAWEEDVAQRFPAWRMLRRDGTFADLQAGADGKSRHPGQWKFNNFLHPDYQDYIEAHIAEIMDRYGKEVDGIFFDIVFFPNDACWSEASRAFREKHGLMGTDAATQDRFQTAGQLAFTNRFSRQIRERLPQASIFYNSINCISIDASQGMTARQPDQTHWELESLPSGFWGYHHFPRLARLTNHLGQGWLGMTGRFQKMWGDFGGLKPQAALEYECFRSQALGGACGVGDQLPPRGTLDAGAYDLIGAVYRQVAVAEPFYAGSVAVPQVGIFATGYPGQFTSKNDLSLEGAIQMCDEAHYESTVLNDDSSFDGLDLLILPDNVVITDKLKAKLDRYRQQGGKLLISFQSGLDVTGQWALANPKLNFGGLAEKSPTYWRARPEFDHSLSRNDRVVYEAGVNLTPSMGMKILVERVLPYFNRTDVTFCSHFQTPPVRDVDAHPAVVSGEEFVYFADPIFREYRQSGNIAVRDGWLIAVRQLIGPPPVGDGLSKNVLQTLRRRGNDLLVTFLHYVPVRKSLDIDIIEEASNFAGEVLTFSRPVKNVRLFGMPTPLPQTTGNNRFSLPPIKGRLLLEVPGYFA